MDETGGVAEGMSGSPVYVTGGDGVPRVVGAIAFGQGDQANVIVGLTPIEQMIDSLAGGARAQERPPSSPAVRRVTLVADRAAARRARARRPGRIALPARPLDRRRASRASSAALASWRARASG